MTYILRERWLELKRSVIAVCTLLDFAQLPDVAAPAAPKLRLAQLTSINFYALKLLQSSQRMC